MSHLVRRSACRVTATVIRYFLIGGIVMALAGAGCITTRKAQSDSRLLDSYIESLEEAKELSGDDLAAFKRELIESMIYVLLRRPPSGEAAVSATAEVADHLISSVIISEGVAFIWGARVAREDPVYQQVRIERVGTLFDMTVSRGEIGSASFVNLLQYLARHFDRHDAELQAFFESRRLRNDKASEVAEVILAILSESEPQEEYQGRYPEFWKYHMLYWIYLRNTERKREETGGGSSP